MVWVFNIVWYFDSWLVVAHLVEHFESGNTSLCCRVGHSSSFLFYNFDHHKTDFIIFFCLVNVFLLYESHTVSSYSRIYVHALFSPSLCLSWHLRRLSRLPSSDLWIALNQGSYSYTSYHQYRGGASPT